MTPSFNFDHLLVSNPKEFVYQVQLNRPDKMNALNNIMWEYVDFYWIIQNIMVYLFNLSEANYCHKYVSGKLENVLRNLEILLIVELYY